MYGEMSQEKACYSFDVLVYTAGLCMCQQPLHLDWCLGISRSRCLKATSFVYRDVKALISLAADELFCPSR